MRIILGTAAIGSLKRRSPQERAAVAESLRRLAADPDAPVCGPVPLPCGATAVLVRNGQGIRVLDLRWHSPR